MANAQGPKRILRIYVEDHLGVRKQSLSYSSDTVYELKAQIGAFVLRSPDVVTLRKLGDDPLQNHLILEDCGFGDESLLGLELDTGNWRVFCCALQCWIW